MAGKSLVKWGVCEATQQRAVAQLGSAPALGAGGPGFKSRQPDSKISVPTRANPGRPQLHVAPAAGPAPHDRHKLKGSVWFLRGGARAGSGGAHDHMAYTMSVVLGGDPW
jgi:hypothetical protein